MTEFENRMIDSVVKIEKSVSTLVAHQEHHERRLDSHSVDIRALNDSQQRWEGAISFAKWMGGAGGILGIIAFILEIIKIYSK